MSSHGMNKEGPFEPNIGPCSLRTNASPVTNKNYPGATLTKQEVRSIERQLAKKAQTAKPSHRDADWEVCDHSKTLRGDHSFKCWRMQRKALWKAYAKACVESMGRTGRHSEPLDVEESDVPEKDDYFICECTGTQREYVIHVSCGNVRWTMI